jgi:CDP-diacylglycerol--serine O-phosphatidyltransferase
MRPPRFRPQHVRRAAPALPNGFTLGNLFFGIFAIVAASRNEFDRAVLYIVLGGVCDAFDGRVARATNTGSPFGEELDSLVDAISFGLAPAMIVYFAVLSHEGWGWLPVFFFTACAVIRLARFNVTQAGEAKSYFLGLPSPAAGGTLATYYWFSQTPLYRETIIGDLPWHEMVRFLMFGLAVLMISNVPYPVWPKIGLRSWRGVLGLLFVVVTVLGISFYSRYYFLIAGVAYALFGLTRAVLLGLVDRIPAGEGEPEFDEDDEACEAEDAAELRPPALPADARVGRRRRKRRRPHRDVPTPRTNTPIEDQLE